VNADATAPTGRRGTVRVIARQTGGVPDQGFGIFTREVADQSNKIQSRVMGMTPLCCQYGPCTDLEMP